MRVLQLVGDPVGGVRKHVHALAEGLARRGVVVGYVHSDNRVDAAFRAQIAGLRKQLEFVAALSIDKRPSFRDLSNIVSVLRYMRRYRIDLVHGHGAKAGLYARVAGRLAGARVVYTPHGGSVHAMFIRMEQGVYRSVERMLRPWTDCYVFESRYSAHGMLGQRPGDDLRWIVNPNGIALDLPLREEAPAARDDLHVGVFGMLRAEKGQDLVIRAISSLRHSGRRVVLQLYGDGPEREALQVLAEDLGIDAAVVFHGDVADALSAMRAMDLIVVPSRFESFGYAAVEALAQGIPTIAARVGGLREIYGEELAGWMVPGGDDEALADKIAWFMDHRDELAALALTQASSVRERFSEERMVQVVFDLYASLLQRG